MLDIKKILEIKNLYIYIIVIILNILIFVFLIIKNNSLKKIIENVGGSNDGYVNGPFGITVPTSGANTFLINVPYTGNYILNISASAYANTSGIIALGIWINGQLTKYKLKGYTNEADSHHLFIPISFKYKLNAGKNYIYLQHITDNTNKIIQSVSDNFDVASINWIYSPL